ncbi:hypothetical protein Hanom_Chr10g00902941 [Helianthus anomalus]
MGRQSNGGSFLFAIDKEENISKLDWCSYVLESLKRTRQGWKIVDSQYNGPLAFLTVCFPNIFKILSKIIDCYYHFNFLYAFICGFCMPMSTTKGTTFSKMLSKCLS